MPAALNLAPPVTFRPFRGPQTTIEEMVRTLNGPRGERSVRVRSFTESIVRGVAPKDYMSEILALRHATAEKVRYVNDPLTTEWVKDPERLVEEIETTGKAAADCDEISLFLATLCRQVGRDVEFVTVGFGAPGNYSHVFTRAKEPKTNRWIVVDPVAGTGEETMLARVTTHKIWRTN